MPVSELKRTEAIERKKQLSNIKYNIEIKVNTESNKYSGKSIISFDFNSNYSNKLMIDAITHEVNQLIINDEICNTFERNESRIYIPTSSLCNGVNILQISYTNIYDNTGSGFHKFEDPEDKEIYIHTDFEPYDARRLFPCFDQPDLKSTYKLTITGPSNWKYIHNTYSINEEKIDKDYIKVEFKETASFSTYLFALVIGPHEMWEDKHNDIPLRLYCRKSLAKYMDPENIFNITKESFTFLENYFDIPYPYEKYDQIFVPEFNFGAMENVACVTFTEHYIFRHKMMYADYLSRSNTIFHEMVHMWFGNLVTMKWWNDLWLNESFADYLSYYAMSKGKLFPDSFEYLLKRKEWAYMQDQLSTTHPIVGSAVDTADAFSNFDGISYSKGASVLKQLMYYIGEDKFRNGIRSYLKKYYEKNTVVDNFLECMSETSGFNIIEWSKQWLETTGVNTLICDNNTSIRQIPSETNNLQRDHAIMYQGYKLINGKTKIVENEQIFIKGENTEISLNTDVEFILLNANDFDYVKIYFNEKDLNFIFNNLNTIEDRFTQRIIWCNLWQMVRDNALSPIWFLKLVDKYSGIENDPNVLQGQMLQKVIGIKNIYLTEKNRIFWSDHLSNLAIENLKKGKNNQFQIAWFDLLYEAAESSQHISELKNILDGKVKYDNLIVDQGKRWQIVSKLCAYNYVDSSKIINTEIKNDPGDLGKKRAFTAKVSVPDLDQKSKWWDTFVSEKQSESSAYLRYGMEGFFWHSQKNILEPYVDKFFNNLKNIYETKDMHYSSYYTNFLFPMSMDVEKTLKQTEYFISENNDLPKLCQKSLKEMCDHLRRRQPILKEQKNN